MIDTISTLFSQPDLNQLYQPSYNFFWVIVSVFLAIFSAYAALKASSRIQSSQDIQSKFIWSFISSLILGLGTWAMHFIGMLSLRLPCHVSYNLWITIFSMIPAILASGAAFGIAWNHNIRHISPFFASLLLGSGIGTMHYSGMAAMQLSGSLRYDLSLFILSLLVAVFLSYIALSVKQSINYNKKGITLVSVILGAAISGMHYTAIAATYFVKSPNKVLEPSIFTPDSLSLIVSLVTLFLIFAALALANTSRARQATNKLIENEHRFQLMIKSLPDPIVFKDVKGHWLIINDAAEKLFHLQGIPWQGANEKDLIKQHLNFSIAYNHYLSDNNDHWQEKNLIFYSKVITDEKGAKRFFEARKIPVFNTQNQPEALLIIFREVTEQKTAEADLRIAAASFEAQEGILITDDKNIILRVNQAFSEITGYSSQEVIGKTPKILNSGRQDKAFYTDMWSRIKRTGAWSGEIWNR
ncbi:MAG: MHYT domain-containing protein, partial [Methyloprofundus sp.]|nr:MHYT domain-containing protein [Methyloprofundus sp.]